MTEQERAGGDERPGIAYVIGTYPRLTTTFIDREIEELRAHGLRIDVCSLRRPHDALSPEQVRLASAVRYVLPITVRALLTGHLWVLRTRPRTVLSTLLELLRQPHPNLRTRLKTVLHLSEGVQVAHLLRGRGYGHIHAHFVDRAAIVSLVASRLLGVGFSATAHANDIYVDPVLLPAKLANAHFVATCTGFNLAHLSEQTRQGQAPRLVRIYHGLDLQCYEPAPVDGRAAPVILAVGQLKEKKGLRFLIEACALLQELGRDFRCEIVGEGPLRPALEARIRERSLEGVVTLLGALDHEAVIERYRTASVFALPCVTGPDGDRDGIPNVILEAMAMQLPVVSTRHSGVPEAVDDGWNGLLVDSGDAEALAGALDILLGDADARALMGSRGRQLVAERFDVASNAKELIRHFEEVLA
jgi:colanic acid/amylovoran biosynthesis glycosyltransferase